MMIMMLVAATVSVLPPKSVPGVTNPAVTLQTMKTTICKKGWSETIRPPEAYTEGLKRKVIGPNANPTLYEEDHLISLELGGSPTDPKNLWPQLYAGKCGAHVKDKLEDKLHTMICKGKLDLRTAQHAISTDWVAAYNKYIGKLQCP